METTIRINTDAITPDLIEGIKKLFPHKIVEITIQPADDTEYILGNQEYSKVLEDRITEYERKKQVISLKPEQLL
jgi:hypothetical protein